MPIKLNELLVWMCRRQFITHRSGRIHQFTCVLHPYFRFFIVYFSFRRLFRVKHREGRFCDPPPKRQSHGRGLLDDSIPGVLQHMAVSKWPGVSRRSGTERHFEVCVSRFIDCLFLIRIQNVGPVIMNVPVQWSKCLDSRTIKQR